MIATGAGALRSMVSRVGAERRHELVVDDLHHHLAGRDRLDHVDADGALAHAVDEGARHVERDVGLEQRAAHFAQGGIDVGSRQRAAPRQAVENAAKLFRQIVEHRFPKPASAAPRSNDFAPEGASALSGGNLRPLKGPGGGLASEH